jgi:hypothetical protein
MDSGECLDARINDIEHIQHMSRAGRAATGRFGAPRLAAPPTAMDRGEPGAETAEEDRSASGRLVAAAGRQRGPVYSRMSRPPPQRSVRKIKPRSSTNTSLACDAGRPGGVC